MLVLGHVHLVLGNVWHWPVLEVLGIGLGHEFSGLGLMACDLINITDI